MKLSEDQKLIHELLGNINLKAAQAYLGALEVLEYGRKDKLHQSANSIRHALSLITRGVKTKGGNHKENIRKVVDPIGGLPPEHDFLISLLVDNYHDWFTMVAHYSKFPTERQYRRKFAETEGVLLKVMRPHFDVVAEIDRILQNEGASSSAFRKMKELIVRDFSSYDHFFRKACGDWLPYLTRGRYFNSQHLIKTKDGVRYGPVPPSAYLARIAEERSEEVMKLILAHEVPKRDECNPVVLENFVTAALKMRSKYACKIARKISKERWVDVQYFSSLDKLVADLMVKLSNDGQHKDAIALAHTLLNVKLSEPYPRGGLVEEFKMVKRVMPVIDDFSYRQIVESKLPVLAKNDPKTLVHLLVYLLNKSMSLENKGNNQKESQDDTSMVWRPAIEDNSQNEHFDFRSVLVDPLRRTLEAEGTKDIRRLRSYLKLISEKEYPFFRRLEIHICRMFPSHYRRRIEQIIVRDFNESEVHHEYYHLLREAFPILTERARRKFLRMIQDGPNEQTIRFWEQIQETDRDATVELKMKVWTLNKLHPIAGYLEGKLKEDYARLIGELGTPEHSDFGFWHSGVMSAEPATELADNLNPDTVMDFVKSYKVQQGGSDFPFYDGTRHKFQEYVEKNPLEFSKRASELKTADPVFSYALFLGLENALKADKEVSWEEPLSLCDYITASRPRDADDRITGYNIFGAIADLLEEGLKRENSLPLELRGTIWPVLKALIPLGDREEQMEKDYPERNWDAIGVSINTTSGKTFHAILQYALWCNKHLKKGKTPEFVPEVKHMLDDYFAKINNTTISRHAVLGLQLPNLIYLDRGWTVKNLPVIFPDNNKRLARAAWDAYLYNSVLPWAFREVLDRYSNHIRNLKNPAMTDGRLTDFDERVIEHITKAYTHNLAHADVLVEELLGTENDLVLQHSAWVVSRILKHYKESPYKSLDLESIRKLWTNAKLARQREADWWFTYSPFDRSETMELFLGSLRQTGGEIGFASTVETHLALYVDEFPLKTAECLELILKSEKNKASLYAVRRTATKDLLKALLHSNDKKAVKKAEGMVHFLGSLGFNEFGELLK